MCNACIIENIRASATAEEHPAIAAPAAGAKAKLFLAQSTGRVVDLTHTYDSAFPTYDGKPGIIQEKSEDLDRDGSNCFKLTIFEHTGTHVDAPLHFAADGTCVAGFAAQNLVCPLAIIDIASKAKDDANATVDKADIDAWISAHGEIPTGALVACHSGWAKKLGQPEFRNTPDGKLAFPGFSQSAATYLLELGAAAIGVDTLSLDAGSATDFPVHRTWLPQGRYGVECLANLHLLPAIGVTVFVGAPKHAGGTGGPARILAVM